MAGPILGTVQLSELSRFVRVLVPCRSSDFSYAFRPNDRWQLRENMVFHMYTVGKGLAFSETVVVTEDGGKRLTQTPRRLLSVPTQKVH